MCTFLGSVIDESDKSWDIEGRRFLKVHLFNNIF